MDYMLKILLILSTIIAEQCPLPSDLKEKIHLSFSDKYMGVWQLVLKEGYVFTATSTKFQELHCDQLQSVQISDHKCKYTVDGTPKTIPNGENIDIPNFSRHHEYYIEYPRNMNKKNVRTESPVSATCEFSDPPIDQNISISKRLKKCTLPTVSHGQGFNLDRIKKTTTINKYPLYLSGSILNSYPKCVFQFDSNGKLLLKSTKMVLSCNENFSPKVKRVSIKECDDSSSNDDSSSVNDDSSSEKYYENKVHQKYNELVEKVGRTAAISILVITPIVTVTIVLLVVAFCYKSFFRRPQHNRLNDNLANSGDISVTLDS